MINEIRKILELAIHAPSGENCQPWRFEVKGHQIDLFNIPERDTSMYSWGQRASYLAHGALIENVIIASSHFDMQAQVKIFPIPSDENLVARVTLGPKKSKKDPLYNSIAKRCTNRKPYKTVSLTSSFRDSLLSSADEVGGGQVKLTDHQETISKLAMIAAVNEGLLFENHYMHKFFFKHLLWTREENKEKSIGLYIKTLELPPPAVPIFKLIRNWNILKLLNRMGFSRLITAGNEKVYASSSAIGAIVTPGNSKEDYILAGRLTQRVWLKATHEGLSFQPLTGIFFLMLKVTNNEAKEFSSKHISLIKKTYKAAEEIFNTHRHNIAMLFRIGEGGEPSGYSTRLPFEQFIHGAQ